MKKIIFLFATVAITGIYLQIVAATELKYIALTLAIIFVVALAGAVFLFGWFVVEKLLLLQAGRIERMKEAHTKTIVAGNQVFIRDTDHRAYWRAAHLDPRFYANGHYSEPTETEIRAWQAFNAPKIIKEPAQLLPAQAQIDLLAALDSVQRGLVVGASDSGKTTLLQWLVSRRLNTSRVIVIDPHAYPHKWPRDAHVVGAGRDYDSIDKALVALVQLMTKRYDEIGRGLVAEMAHNRITILIDEWRAITRQLGKPAEEAIRTLLTESRKAAFSVFVASHSDRAEPLGLKGEYDLKDGFAVVRLTNVNGQRRATLDTGNGEIPATLPGPFAAGQGQVIEAESINLEPDPDPTEAEILRLHQAGESFNEIARQVYGHIGGKQTQQIKQVLDRFV